MTKLLIAAGIGFVYSFMSITTLIAGTSAIVHRGLRGGLAAGAGAAFGLSIYAGIAIVGLGMVQYFLLPVHLAILEIAIGVLFMGTGLFLLIRKRRLNKRTKQRTAVKHHGWWPYFLANLSLILSGPQKIAYIAGLFLFFDLHTVNWATKAVVPAAVFGGSWTAWLLYSLVMARTGKRLLATAFVQHNLERLSHVYRWKLFLKARRAVINKHLVRRLVQLVKIMMVGIGATLAFRGIWFLLR